MPFRENNEKFTPYFLGNTKEEADKTCEEFNRTIDMLASSYAHYTGISKDDLVQEAFIGLARAKRDFEIERSANFRNFAIIKIKSALNEYAAGQALNVSIPQYLKSAHNLLSTLRKLLGAIGIDMSSSFTEVWEKGNAYKDDGSLLEKIEATRQKIINLADRSRVSVKELLKRAELLPSNNNLFYDAVDGDTELNAGGFYHEAVSGTEDVIAEELDNSKQIKILKSVLSEDDFNLLVKHYVEGKTMRELEDVFGIKASSITIKIHKALEIARKGLTNHDDNEEVVGISK